jgi:hypothetical protein
LMTWLDVINYCFFLAGLVEFKLSWKVNLQELQIFKYSKSRKNGVFQTSHWAP